MTERELEIIRETAKQTILQLKKDGLLKDATDIAYGEISTRLEQYFRDGETDPEVTEAIRQLEADPYHKIILLYFRYGYTIEAIAETMDVDVSTITRNKKRLSLRIHEAMQK